MVYGKNLPAPTGAITGFANIFLRKALGILRKFHLNLLKITWFLNKKGNW